MCVRVHFSKGLAKKVLRRPPKELCRCSHVKGDADSHVCGWRVGVQKNPDPSPQCGSPRIEEAPHSRARGSGSRAEGREPAAVASSVSWRPAPPWFCFPHRSYPSLSFSPTSSLNGTPKQRVGIHRQACADRRISCSQGREHKMCVSGSLELCLHCPQASLSLP